MIKISAVSSLTHPGHVADENQDAIYCCPSNNYWLLADGIGGTQGGKLASEIAISSLSELLPTTTLRDAASLTQQKLLTHQKQQSLYQDMGTTVVMAQLARHSYNLAWLGDSRIYNYTIKQQSLEQLSRDHSVVQDMLERGEINSEKAANHTHKHIINRFLGMKHSHVEIDSRKFRPIHDGVLLLCSDGVTDYVSEHKIQSIMTSTGELDLCLQKLQQSLLATAARDNFSIIMVAYELSIATKLINWASIFRK